MSAWRLAGVGLPTAALVACAGLGGSIANFARFEQAEGWHCEVARDGDFTGSGEADLRYYARWLARTRGGGVALGVDDVSLAIATGTPRSGTAGLRAGEIACGGEREPYRITLYRDALVGRPLAMAYRTIAHEFTHIVQVRRDGLPCAGPDGVAREAYEREAHAVAERLVPSCG